MTSETSNQFEFPTFEKSNLQLSKNASQVVQSSLAIKVLTYLSMTQGEFAATSIVEINYWRDSLFEASLSFVWMILRKNFSSIITKVFHFIHF